MFNFKLQTVLDVRKTMEEKSLQEFAEQQRELQRENEQLLSIQRQKGELIDELRKAKGKKVKISEIVMNAEYTRHCMKREVLQKEQIIKAEKIVDVKKEALFDAIKKRKSMEILKTKQCSRYQSDLNLAERTAVDEMAIVRYNRKKEA